MKRNVSVVRLIVATRSSGPPARGKIIKETTGSVASGTPYINANSAWLHHASNSAVCKPLNSVAQNNKISRDKELILGNVSAR